MLPSKRTVVSPEEFDARFRGEADIAEFDSDSDATAYEAHDAFLIHLIKKVVAESCGEDYEDRVHILECWWPNHTRYLDVATRVCTIPLLNSLHDLLTNEFSRFRLQICVYDDIMVGESYIGSMALYADRIVVEARLDSILKPY